MKETLNKTNEGKCLNKMISDCQASSKECVASFYTQLQCLSSECNLSDIPQIDKINDCIQTTCNSSFDELNKLNNEFSQCLQELDQVSSKSGQLIISSFVLIFILVLG